MTVAIRPLDDVPRTVLVVRALPGLGDLLCAVPALRALRVAFPAAQVALLTLERTRPLVERFSALVDELVPFPGWPGMPEQEHDPAELPGFLSRMQARRPGLVLQLHGSGATSNSLCALLGGRRLAGYHEQGAWCPDPEGFLPFDPWLSEVRRPLQLLDALGVRTAGEHLEWHVTEDDRAALAAVAELEPGSYAVVHAGASVAERRWPAERFAVVADALAAVGLSVVLTGTESERPVAAAVAAAMRAPALDLTGRTGLGALGALVDDARLVVANDTGTSHLAAALGTPSVIVFSTPTVDRWAPLDRRRHRPVAGWPGTPASLTTVLDAVREQLAREPVRTPSGAGA